MSVLERQGCLLPNTVRLFAPSVSGLSGHDAVTTDGFGLQVDQPRGRALGIASILDDADLAWQNPRDVVCPSLLRRKPVAPFGTGLWLSTEVGNETGDPGPLRYLDPSLPNVDKIGPDYEARLYLAPHASLSARWRDFLPTDPAIAPRIFDALVQHFPKRKGLALNSAVAFSNQTAVSAEALVAEDLPFDETLGREVPVLRRRLGARLDIDDRYGSGWFGHIVARGENLERPSWSRLGIGGSLGPDWREGLVEGTLARGFHLDPLHRMTLDVDGGIRYRQASGPGLQDGSVTWGDVGVRLQRYGHPTAAARVAVGPSGVGGEATAEIGAGRQGLSGNAEIYASRTLPEADPDHVFWAARGYSGLASEQTPLALEGVPVPTETLGLHVNGWTWRDRQETPSAFDQSLSLNTSARIEARRGETILLPAFTLAPEAVAVSGPVQAVAASGAVADLEATVEWSRRDIISDAAPRVFMRLSGWARARLMLGGDDAFRAARDREPSARLGALAEHSPDGNLNLSARLEWRSATRWEGWPEPDLPAALLADLGLDYTFGAFTLTLTGRNVLGAPEQTHPLGATLDGRLFVRLAARLGG